jgi:hypothetical protein
MPQHSFAVFSLTELRQVLDAQRSRRVWEAEQIRFSREAIARSRRLLAEVQVPPASK